MQACLRERVCRWRCHLVGQIRRNPANEWVLDYIVERKNVADLFGSIKSNRYEQQKYWMKRCGLRHLMYLVEGATGPDVEGELLQRLFCAASLALPP